MARREKLGRCPACNKPRDVEKQAALRRVEEAWLEHQAAQGTRSSRFCPLEGSMRKLARDGSSDWFWACDECVLSGRAILANFMKQRVGLGTPFAAYVDRPFRCEDCGKDAIFGAREQLHWFEKLHFWNFVEPKQCASCRAVRRRQKRARESLADALHGLDPKNPEQLAAVARLYEEMGRTAKATEYRARAKNRRRGSRG